MDFEPKKAYSKDGTKLAYSLHGAGPPIVKTATYITHLVHDWENVVWRPLLTGLSRYNTLLRYDERGSGLSDWYTNDYSWERWVEDLEAVVDAENFEKFVLYGQSQGSTVATAFAAKYPERVEKLIIFGGYARGWRHRDLTVQQRREADLLIDMMRLGWGRENPAFRTFFCSQLMPDAGMERINALNELMKISADPEIAAQLELEMHLSNVEQLAKEVKCSTLILHPFQDASVPFQEGKRLAELIPDSRFVGLDTNNHILQDNEPAWTVFWQEVYRFIGVTENFDPWIQIDKDAFHRVVRTIVFTDIVDSTGLALKLGDTEWIKLLEMHNAIAKKFVDLYEGTIVKDLGDGLIILFESPSMALRCTRELMAQLSPLGLHLRCGVHAGEIKQTAGDIRGINVHLCSRILAEAETDEILVSDVVKELLFGSSETLKFKGDFSLKGIPGDKALFKAL